MHLFEREGFAGNLDHYDDPENSFLDSVLERRLGIPISLSVLMIAVGRRLGVDVQGVGMPGHFLVLDAERGDVWCDPFHGGAVLDADGCRRRFEMVYGGALAFQPCVPRADSAARRSSRGCWPTSSAASWRTDPVQRAWMCELHLAIPGHRVPGAVGARRPARGDRRRRCAPRRVFDELADRAEADPPERPRPRRRRDKLRTRARALRARMN